MCVKHGTDGCNSWWYIQPYFQTADSGTDHGKETVFVLVSGHSGIIPQKEGEPGDEASTLLPFVARTVYVLIQCMRLIYKI